MNKYIAAVMACLVLVAMLAGCHSGDDKPAATEDPVQTEGSMDVTEAVDTAEATEATEASGELDPKGIAVDTKFGRLYYQDQWEEFMRVELAESDTYAVVAFEAEIDGVGYPLFHLTIGESDGSPVGQITDGQGAKHDVFVYMEEISGFSSLTETQQNRLFAMQEEINYIIETLE